MIRPATPRRPPMRPLLALLLFAALPAAAQWVEEPAARPDGRRPPAVTPAKEPADPVTPVAEPGAETGETDPRTVAEILALAPGEWKFNLEMDGEIFPSWVLATAGMRADEPNDPDHIGDPFGVVGVAVRAPRDSCPVELAMECGATIRRSTLASTLPRSGEVYFLYPTLDFDYDLLAATVQPYPATLRATLTLDGKASEKAEKVTVRSVNDCVIGFHRENGQAEQVHWTFAAYVNENHPAIHGIMGKAVDDAGRPMAFSAYQGDRDSVLADIRSIWNVLKGMGLRYGSIRTASLGTRGVAAQHVRRPGESLAAVQANCVDGTALIASILRRMELDVYLVSVPGHMLLAVRLEMPEEGEESGEEETDGDDGEAGETPLDPAELAYIETTRLADGTLEEALSDGRAHFEANREALLASLEAEDGIHGDCSFVSVDAVRDIGLLPLREVAK